MHLANRRGERDNGASDTFRKERHVAKAQTKKARKADPKADPKPKGEKKKSKIKVEFDSGVETLTKLADHPLVHDLLAVGAMAAVAAIAERGVAGKQGLTSGDGSRKAVKAAGKAAAAAIGARLLKEVGDFGTKVATKK